MSSARVSTVPSPVTYATGVELFRRIHVEAYAGPLVRLSAARRPFAFSSKAAKILALRPDEFDTS